MGNELPITKSGDTRQQILDTAKCIILGKGFSAVGLNEILSTAGVPKGSFYHYFKSKEQFGTALLEDYFQDYMAQLENTLKNDGRTAGERLHSYFAAWLESQSSDTTEDKCLVVKLSAEVTDLSEPMRLTLKIGTEQVLARLAVCVQEGIASGEFPKTLNARNVANEIYYIWAGATLMTKVHRTREALECAMQATRMRLNLNAQSESKSPE